MSDIIANQHVEEHMTNRFICEIYRNRRNSAEVLQNGIDPFQIWQNLGYQAFHERVIPAILNRLIQNNLDRGLITYDPNTRRVNLSDPSGIMWTEMNCSRFP